MAAATRREEDGHQADPQGNLTQAHDLYLCSALACVYPREHAAYPCDQAERRRQTVPAHPGRAAPASIAEEVCACGGERQPRSGENSPFDGPDVIRDARGAQRRGEARSPDARRPGGADSSRVSRGKTRRREVRRDRRRAGDNASRWDAAPTAAAHRGTALLSGIPVAAATAGVEDRQGSDEPDGKDAQHDLSPKFRGCPTSGRDYIYFEAERPEDQFFSGVQTGIHPNWDATARVGGFRALVAISRTIAPRSSLLDWTIL